MTYLTEINQKIKDFNLDLDPATQEEISKAFSNRLRNLDAGSEYRWRKDNTREERVLLLLATIAMSRFFPDFDLDHDVPKALGGNNHISNICPCPRIVNRHKLDGPWTTTLDELVERIRGWDTIPEDYVYCSADKWLIHTFAN